MKVIKRHKGLAIVGGLTLILLVVIFAVFSRMIFSNGKGEYGDRLNNIVNIPETLTSKVIEEFKTKDEIDDIKIRTQGKIVYITITFGENVGKDTAKDIAGKILELYDDEIKGCYDFEFILTQKEKLDEEGNDTAFTVVGTKHPEKDGVSWTRN